MLKKFICFFFLIFLVFSFSSCTRNEISVKNPMSVQCGLIEDECNLCANTYSPENKFVIAVVGDGVEDTVVAQERRFSFNKNQGSGMWRGIKLAYDRAEDVQPIKNLIELKSFDDGGSPACAERIAECVYQNSCVLAAIGNANSASTQKAARVYRKAGIPFLMPIATSPYVFYESKRNEKNETDETDINGERFFNLYRLPPSDDEVQSFVLGLYAERLLTIQKQKLEELAKNKSQVAPNYENRIYLLGDDTETTRSYSKPIFDKLDKEILGTNKAKSENVSVVNPKEIAEKIFYSNLTVVIFVGYWSNFEQVLTILADKYDTDDKEKGKDKKRLRPKILLSDGCYDNTLQNKGFEVYVTFPSLNVQDPALPLNRDLENVRSLGERQTYEIFGYDSLKIIAQAISRIRGKSLPISRKNLINELNSKQRFMGTAFSYVFTNGENTISDYYVLDTMKNNAVEKIFGNELNQFKERLQGQK